MIVGDVPPDKSSSPVHAGGFCLLEGDANSFLFSPDDVTSLTKIARDKVDGNLVGNACGASDVNSSAACRNIHIYGSGAPTAATGANQAQTGSLYTDAAGEKLYINGGTKTRAVVSPFLPRGDVLLK